MSTNDDRKGLQSLSRRQFSMGLAALPLIGMPGLSMAAKYPTAQVNTTKLAVTDTEVIVGQLHSATGTMAISETGSIQDERLAIEQINAMGGVLGRQIKIIQEDGASDWPTFAEKSKKLLVNDRVYTKVTPDRVHAIVEDCRKVFGAHAAQPSAPSAPVHPAAHPQPALAAAKG